MNSEERSGKNPGELEVGVGSTINLHRDIDKIKGLRYLSFFTVTIPWSDWALTTSGPIITLLLILRFIYFTSSHIPVSLSRLYLYCVRNLLPVSKLLTGEDRKSVV